MKIKLLFAIILVLSMAWMSSCTDKDSLTGTEAPGGTRTLSFNLTTDAQAQTRAASTTPPTVADHKVQYILQVLNADGSDYGSQVTNETGTFEVELPVGVTYTCLFWAQYIPTAGGSAESAYFTTTDLKAVALKAVLTAEDQCQAFCATADVTADQAAATNTVILKRAVAQVNLRSNESLSYFDKMEATYSAVPNTFNVKDGTVSTNGATGVPGEFTLNTNATQDADGKFTFHSVYFLARGDGNANLLSIELKTYNAGESTPIQTLTVPNVPTKKNYKTNVTATLDAASFTHNITFDFAEWEASELEPEKTISVWNGTVPGNSAGYAFGGGSGTSAADPYIIDDAMHLAQLAANVNAGTRYNNVYFEQTINIDLNNHEWTPIGISTKEFAGIFEGNHKKITNLQITGDLSAAGLFGCTKAVEIKNLHVSGSISTSSIGCAGGISGSTDEGNLTGCSFEGTVSAPNGYAGGICGQLWTGAGTPYLLGCANRGKITGQYVGGITGQADDYGDIVACYNEGEIIGTTSGGGIAPENKGDIIACYDIGDISKSAGKNTLSGTACYAKTAGTANQIFALNAWPGVAENAAWTVDANPDGSENKYWKSIGGWNAGSPIYPKLWWE